MIGISGRYLAAALAIVSGWTQASIASAALLSTDSFSYSPAGSDLVGKNGGTGWTGAWTAGGFNASINNNYDLATGSLQFGPLLTSGDRVSTLAQNAISGAQRNFAQPIGAGDTVTRYLSVLLRPEGVLGGGAFSGFFGVYLDGNGINGNDAFIGKPGSGATNRWVVETRGGPAQFASTIAPVVNETALLVLKAQLLPGNDLFTLYVNPVPGQPEPTIGVLKNDLDLGAVSGLVLYSTGAYSLDEIRWGETFADVVPVPEPASWLLLMLGASIFAMFRRRTRAFC